MILIHKIVCMGFLLGAHIYNLPEGWFRAGSLPESYEMGVEAGAGQNSENAATIKSIDKKINGFGTLMQNCRPDQFLGKRVRMSGYVKSLNVDPDSQRDWAGLWIRVDKKGTDEPLSFDNMSDRPIKGTTEWQKYELVVDVPLHAINIAYGALLAGTGQIWFDNLNFEIVDHTVPTTSKGNEHNPPLPEPSNLNFED